MDLIEAQDEHAQIIIIKLYRVIQSNGCLVDLIEAQDEHAQVAQPIKPLELADAVAMQVERLNRAEVRAARLVGSLCKFGARQRSRGVMIRAARLPL